jgi:hypothetical protein
VGQLSKGGVLKPGVDRCLVRHGSEVGIGPARPDGAWEAAALDRAKGGRNSVTPGGLAGPHRLHRPTRPNATKRIPSEFKLGFGFCQAFEKLHKEV